MSPRRQPHRNRSKRRGRPGNMIKPIRADAGPPKILPVPEDWLKEEVKTE